MKGLFQVNTENGKTALNEDKEISSQVSSYGGYEYKHRYEKLMQTKTAEETSVRITAVIAFAVLFTVVVVALACLLIVNIIISDSEKYTGASVNVGDTQADKGTLTESNEKDIINSLGKSATVSISAGNDKLTGIFVTSDGYIVTGGAPFLESGDISAVIDGKKLSAKIIGINKSGNIAVLKVDSSAQAAADFTNGERVNEGDTVFVAYNSSNGHSVLSGSVSTVSGDSISVGGIGFEAHMYGAALMDENGRVLGIITHGKQDGVCAVSSSFAISAIRQFVKENIEIGSNTSEKIEWLGISVIQITDADSKRFGLPGGVMVSKTESASVAEHIGLLTNDIIIGVESFAVSSAQQLNEVVSRYNGESVSLLVYRNERYININLDVDN